MRVVDAEQTRGGLPITPMERRFAEEYFAGEHAGNGTRAYLSINPESTYDRASVEASILLKSDKVRAFLRELHERITEATAGRLMPWTELLSTAQTVIVATAQGRLRNRLAFEAAVYIVNRNLGSPTASHEVVVHDHETIKQGVKMFSQRLREAQRKQVGAPQIEIAGRDGKLQ
jgi:hypothetical protein